MITFIIHFIHRPLTDHFLVSFSSSENGINILKFKQPPQKFHHSNPKFNLMQSNLNGFFLVFELHYSQLRRNDVSFSSNFMCFDWYALSDYQFRCALFLYPRVIVSSGLHRSLLSHFLSLNIVNVFFLMPPLHTGPRTVLDGSGPHRSTWYLVH